MHHVDGFELQFTHRGSWKANRFLLGKLIDEIPVTWTKSWHIEGKNITLSVWYQDLKELEDQRNSSDEFVVALAEAHDYGEFPHKFKEFRGVFAVKSTGCLLEKDAIEVSVLRRLHGRQSN